MKDLVVLQVNEEGADANNGKMLMDGESTPRVDRKGMRAHLDEANVLGTLPEALPAHVEVVLADDGALVG